jgi:PAS domain S-box-containing protein
MSHGLAEVPDRARADVAEPPALDYKRIFDSAPALLLLLANDGRFSILGATDAYLRATDTVREQILGRGLFEVLPDNPDEPRATGTTNLRASLERVITDRVPDVMAVQKYDVRRPDSAGGEFEVRYWSLVNAPVLSDDGDVLHIVHRLKDVTDLVLSERAAESDNESMRLEVLPRNRQLDEANGRLRQENAQYHAIYDQGPFAGQLNLDGTVIDVNRAYVEGCGFAREEIIGRPFWDCGWWNRDPAIQTWVRTAVMQAVAGEAFRGDSRYFLADGTERIVDFACMPIKDAQANVILVLPTGMDITERVRAEETRRGYEEQRQRAEALAELDRAKTAFFSNVSHELREREERLRAVIETTPECVKLVRADGTLVQMNPSGLAMIGAARAEDMVGRSVYDLVVPEHREMFRAFNERICRGEKGTLEFEMIGAGGVRRHMDTHAAPLAMPDGTTVQLALTRDITARRTAEATVREADRRKDEFIATLSHELRNPLAPLRNALTLLRDGPGPAPATVAALHEMMERQVNHLVRLVDDLLEMSRITRGILELRRARVELGSVVRNAVETSEPLIREAGHRLEIQLPPGPVWLEGDPVRLAQIFANLLNNAARFTPVGGRITIAAEAREGEGRVAVRDTGRGFVPETAASLFEMFSKSDSSSGLGIGLALARRLAELHGGTIIGHSDGEGRGAEFVVTLPITEGEARLTTAPPDRIPVTVARRILVADDNRDSAQSLAYVLRKLGNEVHLAFDGSEAVEVARAFRPDLALIDIGMPQLNGYEAAQRIRVDAGARPLKLVALTGWGQDDDRRRAREAGFDEHIVKPIGIATLRALLERSV